MNQVNLRYIIESLKAKRMAFDEGINFYQTDSSTKSYLENEFHHAAFSSGGACAINLDMYALREILKADMAVGHEVGEWILRTRSDDRVQTVPVVLITKDALDFAIAEFIIAHEIGHIVNGDLNGDNSDFWSARVRQTEILADRYAAKLVGKNKAHEALTFMRDKMEVTISCNKTWPPEKAQQIRTCVQERLEAIAMF